jgi:hypothetical protein
MSEKLAPRVLRPNDENHPVRQTRKDVTVSYWQYWRRVHHNELKTFPQSIQ